MAKKPKKKKKRAAVKVKKHARTAECGSNFEEPFAARRRKSRKK